MGTTTDAVICFGIDIGGGDNEWKIEGVGEYGELPDGLSWLEEEDVYEELCERLKNVNGIEVVEHCSSSFTGYIIAITHTVIRASRGDVRDAKTGFDTHEQERDAELFLERARAALNIDPTDQARWMLVSYWGGP